MSLATAPSVEGANTADRPRRLLGIAVFLANGFLVAFALDATLSVLDEGMRFAGFAGLAGIRNFIAELVVFASVVMGVGLVLVPPLPKRVLLPPVLFALWCAAGAVPLSIAYGGRTFTSLLSLAQLTLAAIAFAITRWRTSRWFIAAENIPRTRFLPLRIAGNVAATAIALPIVGLILVVTSLGAVAERETHGYIRFGLTSVESRETTLAKGEKTVRLVGMVHLGESGFYRSLIASLPANSLVLAEGVSDRNRRLAGGLSYRNAARALGLQQQPNFAMALASAPPSLPEGAAHSNSAKPTRTGPSSSVARPTVLNADVDISEFSPATMRFLALASEIYASRSIHELLLRLQTIGATFTSRDYASFFADVVEKRNRHLLAMFDSEESAYRVIIIPWGAEHMPGIEAALRARGYRVVAQRSRRVAGYATMLAAGMRPSATR